MHHHAERIVHRDAIPAGAFLQVQAEAEAGEEDIRLPDADHLPGDLVRDEDGFEQGLHLGTEGEHEGTFLHDAPAGGIFGQRLDCIAGEVVPEVGVPREEPSSLKRHGDGVHLVLRSLPAAFLAPPLFTVHRGEERMVVLEELTIADQDLPEVEDLLDLVFERKGHLPFVHLQHLSPGEFDGGPLNPVHRDDSRGLSGALDLHLRADGKKVAEDVKGCRVQAHCGMPGIPRPPVPQPEPSLSHGIGEDRAAPDKVLDIGVLWVYSSPAFILLLPAPGECTDPLPALDIHLFHIFLDFWRFECQPLRDHQRHPAPHRVRLHPIEVPVSAHLLLFCRFTVDTDRAVLDDHPEFFF